MSISTPARTAALFISDLHLQESHPRTADAFFRFLAGHALHTRQLYLLGDIFEYWAGDDDLDTPFHARVIAALRGLRDAGVDVFWMAGNRDFLVGSGFAEAAGLRLLDEPHVALIGGVRIALVHGDAECTLDTKYMEFRAMVRNAAWQKQFLAMPLAQRKAIISGLREGSREAHTTKSYETMDVTPEAIDAVFEATGADVLIHGHTHRPALHLHGSRRRYVLPDWELDLPRDVQPDVQPPRGGWIAVDDHGSITRHGIDGLPVQP